MPSNEFEKRNKDIHLSFPFVLFYKKNQIRFVDKACHKSDFLDLTSFKNLLGLLYINLDETNFLEINFSPISKLKRF